MSLGPEIIRIIESCDFGIVVYNELRHNVSYEWGLLDAIIGKNGGHVFLLRDGNIHIDLDRELSDKKGVVFTTFYGEDSEEKIIESLSEDHGLIDMIKECIGEVISNEKTPELSELAESIVSSPVPIEELQKEPKIKEKDAKYLEEKFEQITNLTAQGHFYKASVHYYAKEYEKAKKELEESIRLNPDNSDAHSNLGIILLKLKKV